MTHSSPGSEPGPSQRAVEVGVAITMLVFAAIVIGGSLQAGINWGAEGPKAGFFPFYVGLVIMGASLFNLVSAFADRTPKLFADWSQLGQVLSVIIPTAVYVALVPWLGLYMASFLLIAVFMRWLGHYGWTLTATIAVGVPLAAFILFEKWFLVPLPKGPVEDWLGL
jgi:hypothetical protein